MADKIEIHRNDDWSGLYLNGELQTHGDHYHADEWLYQRFGVKIVHDSPWLLPDSRTPRQTLAEVQAAAEERQRNLDEAVRLRDEAQKMIDRANALERAK